MEAIYVALQSGILISQRTILGARVRRFAHHAVELVLCVGASDLGSLQPRLRVGKLRAEIGSGFVRTADLGIASGYFSAAFRCRSSFLSDVTSAYSNCYRFSRDQPHVVRLCAATKLFFSLTQQTPS